MSQQIAEHGISTVDLENVKPASNVADYKSVAAMVGLRQSAVRGFEDVSGLWVGATYGTWPGVPWQDDWFLHSLLWVLRVCWDVMGAESFAGGRKLLPGFWERDGSTRKPSPFAVFHDEPCLEPCWRRVRKRSFLGYPLKSVSRLAKQHRLKKGFKRLKYIKILSYYIYWYYFFSPMISKTIDLYIFQNPSVDSFKRNRLL